MESFAKALSELPTAIAENGGFDSAQLVSELRALHKQNKSTMTAWKFREIFLSRMPVWTERLTSPGSNLQKIKIQNTVRVQIFSVHFSDKFSHCISF